MKKVLLVLLAVTLFNCEDECTETATMVSQRNARVATPTIDLSGMTGDLTLNPSDAVDHELRTTGDLNLNGFKLTLKNIKLTVSNNLNGGGTVKTQGSKGAICVIGATQNNPNLSQANVSCETLSNGGVQFVEGGDAEVPCGFDYDNQQVQRDVNGRSFYYKRK